MPTPTHHRYSKQFTPALLLTTAAHLLTTPQTKATITIDPDNLGHTDVAHTFDVTSGTRTLLTNPIISPLNLNPDTLLIGDVTDGSLLIDTGSELSNGRGILGHELNASGTAKVTGAGSQWNNSSDFLLGEFGTGILNIQAGGVVTNAHSYLGRRSTSASGTVTDIGSQWNINNNLYVGELGTGTLNIQAGAIVNNSDSYIGHFFNSSGTATIHGTDSLWNNSGTLVVGDLGTATLNVQNGGAVNIGENLILQDNGGTSTLNFTILSLNDPLIDVAGDVQLAGSLHLNLDPTLTLRLGHHFELIDIEGTQVGAFSNYAEGDLLGQFNGIDLFLSYIGGDGNDVTAYTVNGIDFNNDGNIEAQDWLLFVAELGSSNSTYADLTNDGVVDHSDFLQFKTLYDAENTILLNKVPEPAGLTILGFGGLAIMRRRRS